VNDLKYGAVYTPWLAAQLTHPLTYANIEGISINLADGTNETGFNNDNLREEDGEVEYLLNAIDLLNTYTDENDAIVAAITADPSTPPTVAEVAALTTALDNLVGNLPVRFLSPNITTARDPLDAAIAAYDQNDDTTHGPLISASATFMATAETTYDAEATLRRIYPLYRQNKNVWKAPANESVLGILGPTTRYTQGQLENLNVSTTGKSINAIRAFTGKGTLIYGARTLAGNSGEDRYVNVRRLLIFLEESIKKACETFVFEPNDANTWLRVRGMIENFLDLQWRAGALQGARREDAFRVAIGLGQTMTADDVTNGRMLVDISIAPVRPAEFIILRFSQQQAQS